MRRLKVVGFSRGTSGYDRHTREMVRAFVRQGAEIELKSLPGWSPDLPPHRRETWFDRLAGPVAADTALHFVVPNHLEPEPGMRNVNYTMFEATRIPPFWVEAADRADLIVLTTEAGRRAWAESGVDESKLRVSPLGVDGQAFASAKAGEPYELIVEGGRPVSDFRTRFLNVAELRPRKNHLGLIEAWIRATRSGDDAVLILKMNLFSPHIWPAFEADLADLEARLGRPLSEAAPVAILAGQLEAGRIPSLYAAASHYISMSRGEGWDLPMMEAAAAGLELVAPGHSAYPAWLADDEAHWIPAEPKAATFEGRLGPEDAFFFRGLDWWEPDLEAAAETIRQIVAGRAAETRSPQRRVLEEYSWEKAARSLLEIVLA